MGAVSVYDTVELARETVRRFPQIGSFIAELEISEGGAVAYEKSLRDPHHHDRRGDPGAMLAAVVRVLPV